MNNRQISMTYKIITAIFNQSESDVKNLIESGEDLNSYPLNQSPPILQAIRMRQKNIVKMLIIANAKLNVVCTENINLICHAARLGDIELFKLIANKFDASSVFQTKTLRFAAGSNGSDKIEIIKYLLEGGTPLDENHPQHGTAFYQAAIVGDIDTITYLAEKGADINAICGREKNRPITAAIKNHHIEVVRFLINQKANLNIRLIDGSTPLYIAAELNLHHVVRLLLENNADKDIVCKTTQLTASQVASAFHNINIVRLFAQTTSNYLQHYTVPAYRRKINEPISFEKNPYAQWDGIFEPAQFVMNAHARGLAWGELGSLTNWLFVNKKSFTLSDENIQDIHKIISTSNEKAKYITLGKEKLFESFITKTVSFKKKYKLENSSISQLAEMHKKMSKDRFIMLLSDLFKRLNISNEGIKKLASGLTEQKDIAIVIAMFIDKFAAFLNDFLQESNHTFNATTDMHNDEENAIFIMDNSNNIVFLINQLDELAKNLFADKFTAKSAELQLVVPECVFKRVAKKDKISITKRKFGDVYYAIDNENQQILEKHLKKIPYKELNAYHGDELPFLLYAIQKNKVKSAITILKVGANPNVCSLPNEIGVKISAVMLSVKTNDVELVNLLLEKGADISITLGYNHPLSVAIASNNLNVARVLLDQNSSHKNINFDLDYLIPSYIEYFLSNKLPKAAAFLKEYLPRLSADKRKMIYKRNHSNMVPPLIAAINRYAFEDVKLYVDEYGANPNVFNNNLSALANAAIIEDTQILAFLIKSGANVNSSSGENSALFAAVSCNNLAAAQCLLKAKANPNVLVRGKKLIFYVLQRGDIDMIKLFLADESLQLTEEEKQQLVPTAMGHGHGSITRYLIKTLNSANINPSTLQHACLYQDEATVATLLPRLTDIDKVSPKISTIYFMADFFNIRIIKILSGQKVVPKSSHSEFELLIKDENNTQEIALNYLARCSGNRIAAMRTRDKVITTLFTLSPTITVHEALPFIAWLTHETDLDEGMKFPNELIDLIMHFILQDEKKHVVRNELCFFPILNYFVNHLQDWRNLLNDLTFSEININLTKLHSSIPKDFFSSYKLIRRNEVLAIWTNQLKQWSQGGLWRDSLADINACIAAIFYNLMISINDSLEHSIEVMQATIENELTNDEQTQLLKLAKTISEMSQACFTMLSCFSLRGDYKNDYDTLIFRLRDVYSLSNSLGLIAQKKQIKPQHHATSKPKTLFTSDVTLGSDRANRIKIPEPTAITTIHFLPDVDLTSEIAKAKEKLRAEKAEQKRIQRENIRKQKIEIEKQKRLSAAAEKKRLANIEKQKLSVSTKKQSAAVPLTQDESIVKSVQIAAAINPDNLFILSPVCCHLSTEVMLIFNHYFAQIPDCYLAGSTVSHTLNNEKQFIRDYDFVGTCPNPEILLQHGFKRVPHKIGDGKGELYTFGNIQFLHIPGDKLDLIKDCQSRDFHLLYCDRFGNVFDPTGTGLQLVEQKEISLGSNPEARLREDPRRILRALKLMACGYAPDELLEIALNDFQADWIINKIAFHAKMKEYLDDKTINQEFLRLVEFYAIDKKIHGLNKDFSASAAATVSERNIFTEQYVKPKAESTDAEQTRQPTVM